MIKRIFAIILAAAAGAGLICGIWYKAAPREFLQTVLSDSAYAGVTLTQNGAHVAKTVLKASKKHTAYAFYGTMKANVDKSALLNSEKVATAVSDYMSSLNLSGKVFFDSGNVKVTGALSDSDNVFLSGETVFKGTRQLIKIDQLGGAWFEKTATLPATVNSSTDNNAGSENAAESAGTAISVPDIQGNTVDPEASDQPESSDTAAPSATADSLSDGNLKEQLKDTKAVITITDTEQTLTVGGASATGEVVTYLTATEGFYELVGVIGNKLNNTDYAFVTAVLYRFAEFAEKNDADEIVLSMYVDKKNRIVGISIGLNNEDDAKDIVLMAVKNEASDGNYEVEYYTGKAFIATSVDVSETEYEEFTVPDSASVIPIDKDSLKAKLQEYIFGPLLDDHPQFSSVLETIAGKVVSNKISDFIAALKNGGLIAGISNIKGSAAGMGDEVKEIADSFLSAFGIRGDHG